MNSEVSNNRKYREVKRLEFEGFLKSICQFEEYPEEHYLFDFIEESPQKYKRVEGFINEFCYYVAIDLDRGYCLKIYSSIDREDSVSRDSGTDAIRVVVANANTGEPIRLAFPIVKRIKNWRKNIHRRMSEAIQSLGIKTACPLCDSLLLLRKRGSDETVFLGCSEYPDCKGSRDLVTQR